MSEVKRFEIKYKNLSEKFLINSVNYQKQYYHLYTYRLREFTPLLVSKARQKWGNKYDIKELCDLCKESEDKCIVIGTLYKQQAFKPSILKEISEENQLAPQPQPYHYTDDDDKLSLEDNLQKTCLIGKIDTQFMSTGVVCAVLGHMETNANFFVNDIIFYEGGPQKGIVPIQQSAKLVLISGINQTQCELFSDSLNLFQHWLCGNISAETKNIVRLIVAGNSVRERAEKKQPGLQLKSAEHNETLAAVKSLDKYFASWSQSIPLDLMPGEFDPASFMMPQQPFHPRMFAEAACNSSFQSVTNPYACEVGYHLVMGTSGQNIRDLLRCTNIDDQLQALRSTLQWSHISPTSPDTLGCFPYTESDPFIIRECPSIYFAGNCEKFQTELHTGSDGQKTRLVCIPSFSKTKSVVVVDLNSLDCCSVSFAVSE